VQVSSAATTSLPSMALGNTDRFIASACRSAWIGRPWSHRVVVDSALNLPGVDPERIALMAVSMGGVLAPRAVAFEKRISALVANDGIYDFGAPRSRSCLQINANLLLRRLIRKKLPSLTACSKRA
jgi:hypothetical protein